ncbi:PREDICTED: leucine-rich repeat and calponin homology domain-containing protein 4-like [Corvus brachyrhynchos]|uniref:leucine-rich repeat and calponin homology domain-containing protein 4-like n=1 Tax=Corvus brachyrhynchos TaxID=85066 RepID=UPI00081668D9|nr:PREDICTED: leucine-rich repeat and calponin homology domain-containing protein 4-like [Corvus brachyrhynchos]
MFALCSPPDEPCPLWPRGGLDSGFHSVDSGSKRWSGNESTDESSELSRQHREMRSGAAGDSDPEQLEEEPTPEEQQSQTPRGDTPEDIRGVPTSRRRPKNLEVWRERERKRSRDRYWGFGVGNWGQGLGIGGWDGGFGDP